MNARRFDDLLSFSRRFFVEEVHPGQNEALCPGWKDRDCEAVARELFEALQKVLPTVDQPESFSPWPHIAVDLPFSEVSAIERDRSIARAKITQSSTVSGDARAAEIFGLSSFGAARSLGDVLAQWRGQFPDRTAAWFDFCCEQIIQGSVRELPVVRCSTVKDAAGPAEFTALLNQVKRSPRENKVTFEFAFFDLADPRGTVVTERMIPAGAMLKFTIGNQGPSAVDLRALRKFLKDNARNRLPLLNPSNAALYVIHRSTIDEFLLDTDIAQPTLADLLQQPGKQDALESSVAFVPQDANLAEAAAELTSACSDVFVTLNGRSDEPILGWLTNADLSRDAVRRRAAGSDA